MPTESDVNKPTGPAELPHLPVEAIQAELEKILASSEFQGSAMLRQVLRFVVGKTLAGNPQEIKGYTIATQVLGRGADFDGGKDPIVRVLGGRLRQALDHYYLTRGAHSLIRIDIPKGSYVPIFRSGFREEDEGGAAFGRISPEPPLGANHSNLALAQSLG